MIATTVDADTLAAIMVFPKKYSGEIHTFIYSVNVNEVRLPKDYAGRPFYEMYALIEENRLRAQEEICPDRCGAARPLEHVVPGTRRHKKTARDNPRQNWAHTGTSGYRNTRLSSWAGSRRNT